MTLVALASWLIGYDHGRSTGWQKGSDAVFCAMDRIANSHPVGARGASINCKRIDAARDARS